MATKKSKKELSSRYDGRVESDDIVNEHQWRAIQRFGGGKVAAEKARKVAMERLKKLTGKDVAYEYMFANTDDVPLPPPPPRDPLFDDEVSSPRVATRSYHSRSPSQGSRSHSNSPRRRSVSSSPERTPRESSFRRSPQGSFSEATLMPKASATSTVASTPPHGRDLRPAEFRKGAHLPNYSSPPDTASTRSPKKSNAEESADTSPPQHSSGLADRISPGGARSSQDPMGPKATQSPTRQGGQSGRPRPASASPGGRRPGHIGRGWKPGGTGDTLRGKRSEEKKQEERKLQEAMHRSVSPGKGYTGHSLRRSEIRSANQWRKSASEEEIYKMWRAGRADPKTPPWKHSQPQSSGPMVPIEVVAFNFDEAHPAVAEEHFKRTKEQNEMIEAERKAEELRSRKIEMKVERENALETISRTCSRVASRAGSRSVSYSGGVSPPGATARSMSRTTSRPGLSPLESEMYQVKAMEREAEELKRRTREAQARAQNAIKTSGQQSSFQRQQRGIPAPPPQLAGRISSRLRSPQMIGSPTKRPSFQAEPQGSGSALDMDVLTQKVEALARGIASQAADGAEEASNNSFPVDPYYRRSSISSRSTPRELGKIVSFDGYAADYAGRAQSPETYESSSSPDGSPGRTSQAETEVMAAWVPQRMSRVTEEAGEQQEQRHGDDLPSVHSGDMEVMVAAGKFDPQRYDDYVRAMNVEMEERAHRGVGMGRIEDGYNSDLEREQEEVAAAGAAEAAALEAELEKYPERRGLHGKAEEVEILREEWLKQDDWMDYYRQGPEYEEERQRWEQQSGGSSPQQGRSSRQLDFDGRMHTEEPQRRVSGDETSQPPRAGSAQDGGMTRSPGGARHYRNATAHLSESHQYRPAARDQPPRPLPTSPPTASSPPRPPPQQYQPYDVGTVRHGFSADDLELLNSEYIPFIQPEFPVYAIAEDRRKDERQQGRLSAVYTPQFANYHSEGEDRGDSSTVYWPLTKSAKKKTHKAQHRTLRCTVPQPFTFEHRDSMRRKPIIATKLEAELALKRQEEHSARTKAFRASPFPKSTMEPRFSMLMEEWETMRASNRESTRQWFKAIEAPFSFYYTDRLRTEAKKEVVKKMTNPDRFQQRFRAKPPPEHVFEDRFKELMQEQEDKRMERRARAEEKLADVSMPRGMEERMEVSQRRMRERDQRRVDPEWQTKHPKYPLGYMPNFNELHQEMAFDLAKERARVRRGVTVPQEFNLGGRTREEAGTRKLRALERKKAIELDMLRDQDDLPETRWPYATPRGKVIPSAIPATRSPAKEYIRQTHTSMLRASNMRKKLSKAAEKDKEREEAEAEQHRLKAKALVKKRMKERVAKKAAGAEAGETSQQAAAGDGSDGEEEYAQPMQYVDARHKQAGERGRQMYEDSLLEHGGIDAYRYVEGAD